MRQNASIVVQKVDDDHRVIIQKSLFSARLKKVRNYDRNSSDHVSKGQIVISAAQEIGNNTVQIKTL